MSTDRLRDLMTDAVRDARVPSGAAERALAGARRARLYRQAAVASLAVVAPTAVVVGLVSRGDAPRQQLSPVASPSTSATPSPAERSVHSDLPRVAELVCEPGRLRLLTPQVQVQPDGIHLRFRSTLDGPAVLIMPDQGDGVPDADTVLNLVITAPPGKVPLACGPGDESPWKATLLVADPNNIYLSDDLQCPPDTGIVGQPGEHPLPRPSEETSDPSAEPTIAASADGGEDPVALTRRRVDVQPDDTVEVAGYPQAMPRSVRVVRAGRTVAVHDWIRDPGDPWRYAGGQSCGAAPGD